MPVRKPIPKDRVLQVFISIRLLN